MGLARRIADYAKGIFTDSSGNVGIGTTSPAGKLEIIKTKSGSSAESYDLLRFGLSGTRALNDAVAVKFGAAGSATNIAEMKCISGADDALYGTLTFSTRRYTTDSLDEAVRIDNRGNLRFDSGYGSVATAYGCRAWVNFDGTGTVSIRASGNVSSITDNGVGNYTLNFTNAMPDTNYAYGGAAIRESSGDAAFSVNPGLGDTKSTTQFQTRVVFANTRYDVPQVNVFIFR